MKKLLMAAILCWAMTTVVNAQTSEPESNMDKYLRLSKEADENPTNWQAQLEVGHMLLDKENSFYNMSRAAKYYERIYQQAAGFNKEVPDSVVFESIVMLMTMASDKKDVKKVLFYTDELVRAEKMGVDVNRDYVITCGWMGVVYSLMNGDPAKALCYMLDVRKLATAEKKPGIDYSDPMTVMLYENLLSEYRKTFGDRLPEFTLDGKKYIVIAMNKWNVEMPLMGWMGGVDDDGNDEKANELKLFYGEDGKVYDDMHGEMNYSFNFTKDGFVPQEGYNVRMITVTPEQRQKMVDAYHNYMKKYKKDQKK
ncbi:MAG: hypothetical protein IJQ49_01760 [Prevotella sp.]|nr:hypothetical protein [Prevotella sp.]